MTATFSSASARTVPAGDVASIPSSSVRNVSAACVAGGPRRIRSGSRLNPVGAARSATRTCASPNTAARNVTCSRVRVRSHPMVRPPSAATSARIFLSVTDLPAPSSANSPTEAEMSRAVQSARCRRTGATVPASATSPRTCPVWSPNRPPTNGIALARSAASRYWR